MHLSDRDRAQLNEILESIGLTQKAVAQRAGLSQPWLSQVLNGHRKRPETDKIKNLCVQLSEYLKKRHADPSSLDQAKKHREHLAFLGRIQEDIPISTIQKVYSPGGRLPVDAQHYIERQSDERVMEALKGIPFTMLVAGPVQCGKSSLLARLEHKAQQIGIETAWFDPQTIGIRPDVNSFAVSTLSKLLQARWNLKYGRNEKLDSIERLNMWLPESLNRTRSQPRLLIVDDIASLGASGVEEWFSSFIRTMNKQISLAIGMTHHFVRYFTKRLLKIESIVHWNPKIELDWFSQNSIQMLEDVATGSRKNPVEDEHPVSLYDLFHGQPYLSHASIVDPTFRKAVERWNSDCSETNGRHVREAAWYKQHCNAIKFAILGPDLEGGINTGKLVQMFIRACSGGLSAETADWEYLKFLEKSKLLSGDQGPGINENINDQRFRMPVLKIYRLIAEDLAAAKRI